MSIFTEGKKKSHTHESLPAFTSPMRCLYVGIGEEPVGRPSTNGFPAVGLKSRILTVGYAMGKMECSEAKATIQTV